MEFSANANVFHFFDVFAHGSISAQIYFIKLLFLLHKIVF